jgi:GMP synthase-like glutamine amidotransferase|tara:strand:+ start:817 stop:1515 length:699 start_codon:yes stop_codon:yes gene_type:complete
MKFLVLQHIAIEHPGIFLKFMKRDNIQIDTIELDEGEAIPDLKPYDAMIVMGGPMDTWQEKEHPWLVPEKESIYEFTCIQKKPYLGLCLGAQLLGEIVGGKVKKMDKPEIGALEVSVSNHDSIFNNMSSAIKVLQWHSYEVTDLPRDAKLLASSDECLVQAFSYNHAFGLQFHVEQTDQTVPEWSCVPEYKSALEETLGKNALEDFESKIKNNLTNFNKNAEQIYNNFIRIC